MGNGEWGVGSGEWGMGNRNWRIGYCQLFFPTPYSLLPIFQNISAGSADCNLRVAIALEIMHIIIVSVNTVKARATVM